LKGDRSELELIAEFSVIHQWKTALLEAWPISLSGVVEKGPKISEGTVRSLYAKLEKLALANESTVRASIFCHESSCLGPAGAA
jgi:hypothetical protein